MKYLVAVLLSALSFMAFALPTPNEVDAVYNSGNYGQAEQMLNEVLAYHPTAKAHFRLAEVYIRQGRHEKALYELKESQTLDPTLSFVKSPEIFRNMLSSEQSAVAIKNQSGSVTVPAVRGQVPPVNSVNNKQPQENESHTFFYGFLILLGLAFIAMFFVIWKTSADSRKRDEKLADEEKEKVRAQLKKLLEYKTILDNAELTYKSANYSDEVNMHIRRRIDACSSILLTAISTTNDGEQISSYRIELIGSTVTEISEVARTGQVTLHDTTEPETTRSGYNGNSAYTTHSNYSNTIPPSSTYQSPRDTAYSGTHTTVINNGSNGNDLLTGVLIGEMLSSNNHTRYEEDVVVRHHVVNDTPTYSSPTSSWDDSTTKASSSSSWDDDRSTSSSSSSSWSDDSSSSSSSSDSYSDSSSSSSSSSDW